MQAAVKKDSSSEEESEEESDEESDEDEKPAKKKGGDVEMVDAPSAKKAVSRLFYLHILFVFNLFDSVSNIV